jgi:hypothetical protein
MTARLEQDGQGRQGGLWYRVIATAVIVAVTAAILGGAFGLGSSAASLTGAFSSDQVAVPGGSNTMLDARSLTPGRAVTGQLVVTNSGTATGHFWMGRSRPAGQPAGTDVEAGRLLLVVADVTHLATPRVLYRGSVSGLSSLDLGVFSPGEARVYRLTVSLPATAALDGSSAGAGCVVAVNWTAVTG